MDSPTADRGAAPAPQDAAPPAPSAAPVVVAGSDGDKALQYGDLHGHHKLKKGVVKDVWAAFLPNRAVSPNTMRLIVLVEAAVALLIWLNSPYAVLPRPLEVIHALQRLWMEQGLGRDLIISFEMNVEALAWTALISLVLSYLTVLPVFRPIVAAVSKGRFLSLVGFSLIFVIMVGGGHKLKLWMLVFAMTVFFVTSMAAVIVQIPKGTFDHARTLRMNEWQVVWEVVILGTADKAFEVLRQNAAIGWMMLTMVEGIVRSEGGIGAVLLTENKYMHMDAVFAIQLLILAVGLIQDYAIGVIRRLVCPYADLTLERRGA